MKTYTLQRFYNAAQALIEKYGLQNKGILRVDLQLEQEKPGDQPQLECCIRFEQTEPRYGKNEPDSAVFGFGLYPETCLASFDEKLARETKNAKIPFVSVELKTSNSQPETPQP